MKTGKVAWSVEGFGAGTVTLIGDRLLLVRESGEAVIAAASSKSFETQSQSQLLPGPVRSYPALEGNRIYIRNEHTMAAYSLVAGH